MPKNRLLPVLIVMLLAFSEGMYGQQPFDHLGIGNGLSNNTVNAIYRDHYGFMWFGTDDGLNRYDGYGFTIFRNRLNVPTSLVHNQIQRMAEDKAHNLWVGTKQGLCVFNSYSSSFRIPVYLDNKGNKVPVTAEIYDIIPDSAGNMLIATAGKGLLVYDPAEGFARQVTLGAAKDSTYQVKDLSLVGKQDAWALLQGRGLYYFDGAAKTFRLVSKEMNQVNMFKQDKHGTLWFATNRGLGKISGTPAKTTWYTDRQGLSENRILYLDFDATGHIWIGTDGGGVNILDPATGTIKVIRAAFDKGALSSDAISCVYIDPESRKWIGTLRGGLNIIDSRKNNFVTIAHNPLKKNSLVNDFVLSFCEDQDGKLWIGTDGGGVSLWDRSQNTFRNFVNIPGKINSLSKNFVTSMVRDRQQTIWLSTYGGGINRYRRESDDFAHYSCRNGNTDDRAIWKLFIDSKGTLWACAVEGGALYRFNAQRDTFEPFDHSITNVITLFEDPSGTLWAGTFNQLIRIDKTRNQHKIYQFDFQIRGIVAGSAGHIWVGTQNSGLLDFDPDHGTWKTYTEHDGLSNNSVLNIVKDDSGNLWMSTFNGISRFNTAVGKFKNFYEQDGLQSNQFNYNAALKLASGEIVMGGIKGFNLFRPEAIRSFNVFPEVRITGLRVLNTTPDADEQTSGADDNLYTIHTITLPFNKAVISFDFVALDYSSSGKINYAYKLDGWDAGWTYTRDLRTANYSRLKEGSYTLLIKSTNGDGEWSPEERKIAVIVLPPWYRTWLAYFIYAVVAAFAIWFYNRYRVNRTKLEHEVELTRLKAAQEAELNERRLSFFTHVSHEFRTPLTLIINPVKELLYSKNKEPDQQDLSTVYRNAKRLLNLVDQLLLFRKAESGEDVLKISRLDLVSLCKEVFLCFTNQAKSKKIKYTFTANKEETEIFGDREKLEIALFNLFSNAFKFTPNGGSIAFTLEESDGRVEIHVKDSGSGVSAEAGQRLFERYYQDFNGASRKTTGFGIGLFLTRKFITAHGGSIDYTSRLHEGTNFGIILLKGKDHLQGNFVDEPDVVSTLGENSALFKDPLSEDAGLPREELGHLVSDRRAMLIIDDDQEIRNFVRRLFSADFIVYEAPDGEIGLELAAQYVPDMIICDVVMPGMNGIALCERIKSDPELSHIPIILLTSSSATEVKLQGIECGADDYITKPFDTALFTARITNILKGRSTLQKYFYNEITLKPDNLKIPSEYKEFLKRCIAIIEEHLEDKDFTAKTLAAAIGTSHSNLYKKVKSISGKSVSEFIRFIRLRKAAQLLINTDHNVSEAAFNAGFHDIKYFREQFNKVFGINPSEYLRKYRKPLQSRSKA